MFDMYNDFWSIETSISLFSKAPLRVITQKLRRRWETGIVFLWLRYQPSGMMGRPIEL